MVKRAVVGELGEDLDFIYRLAFEVRKILVNVAALGQKDQVLVLLGGIIPRSRVAK